MCQVIEVHLSISKRKEKKCTCINFLITKRMDWQAAPEVMLLYFHPITQHFLNSIQGWHLI